MLKMLSLAVLATACAAVVTSIAVASDVTPNQRTAIQDAGKQFFRAVVDGNAHRIAGFTTPSFTLTTLEGQTLSASELASQWRAMMIEYGGVHGAAKLESASIDGNTITTVFSVNAYADTLHGGYDRPHTSALNAVHRIVWVAAGGDWKAVSDVVLRQNSDFHAAPAL